MTTKITELLGTKIILFDGATGTLLQMAGLGAGELPDLWNITHPDVIRDIHLKYLRAGADVITTSTFGSLQHVLSEAGSEYKTADIYKAALSSARSAVETIRSEDPSGPPRFVAADLGPTRKLVGMPGGINANEVYEMYKEAVIAAENGGADLLIFETFTDVLELKAAVLAAKDHSKLPIFATMTYEKHGRTLTGTDPVTAINIMEGLGIDAFGVNCSLGPDALIPIAKELADNSMLPVIVQPNAGMPIVLDDGSLTYDMKADDFTEKVIAIAESGAAVIGGCCGTNYDFIHALRQILDELHADDPARFPALEPNWYSEKRLRIGKAVCSATRTIPVADIDINDPGRDFISCLDKDIISSVAAGNYKQSDGRKAILLHATTPENLDGAMMLCRGKPGIIMDDAEPGCEAQILAVAEKHGAVVIK